MDRRDGDPGAGDQGFPRTRGDGPFRTCARRATRSFPPHALGWTRDSRFRERAIPVSPARTGMDRYDLPQ